MRSVATRCWAGSGRWNIGWLSDAAARSSGVMATNQTCLLSGAPSLTRSPAKSGRSARLSTREPCLRASLSTAPLICWS